VTYRAAYDRLRFEGFIAGSGNDGFRANVRSAIKRIRNKFRACDPAFDAIENYTGFGYCWRKPFKGPGDPCGRDRWAPARVSRLLAAGRPSTGPERRILNVP
jgi:hypothetical protein